MRLCLYGPLRRLRLIRSRLVTEPGVLHRFIDHLDGLPPYPFGVMCPEDRGSAIVAFLRYLGPHNLAVHIGLEGCKMVTNGSVVRSTWGATSNVGHELVAELHSLIGGFPPQVTPDE